VSVGIEGEEVVRIRVAGDQRERERERWKRAGVCGRREVEEK
jgi:hypothetical protein